MKFRPEAEIFPLMSDDELKDLAKDIDEHGQLHPISLYQGEILDGRNRYLAITKFSSNGHQPQTVDVNPESPIAFVVSGNEKRRHLTPTQVAIAGARALPFYEAEAQKRMLAGVKDPSVNLRKGKGAAADVAEVFGSSPRTVEMAKRVLTKGSKKLVDAIDRGGLTVGKANEIIRQYPDKTTQAQVVDEIAHSKMTSRVKGLTGEIEWYTPRKYLDSAVEVMGAIDLDPASSENAQSNVMAGQYFTREDNGLTQHWHGRVFLNPPYAMPLIKDFTTKMVDEYQAGRAGQGILLTNNATDTEWFHLALAHCSALCFTKGRIRFIQVRDGEQVSKDAPTHGQVFFYFGPDEARFQEVFSQHGFVLPVPNVTPFVTL